MPKTVKTTPEKEKNIFQRAFDRLPEGLKNFIRTIRDVAVSITNRVIFGNKQAERLRKADVDEILRKEKEEREQLGSDDKDAPKDTKEKDTKEDKEEIEELPETEEWLAGFAGIEDLEKLSKDLWEKNIPHKLVDIEGETPYIEYEYNEDNGAIKIELIENASDIQEADIIRYANDNDAIVRLVNGDKTYIVSATAAYVALGKTLEKEQSFLEAKRELYVGLQEKLSGYNPTIVIAEREEARTLHTNYHSGSEVLELNQGNPLYITLHYENKDYATPYSNVSITNARDVIEKGEAPLYKIGEDVFQEKELFDKIADTKTDFEQKEPKLAKEFQFYAEHGDWEHEVNPDEEEVYEEEPEEDVIAVRQETEFMLKEKSVNENVFLGEVANPDDVNISYYSSVYGDEISVFAVNQADILPNADVPIHCHDTSLLDGIGYQSTEYTNVFLVKAKDISTVIPRAIDLAIKEKEADTLLTKTYNAQKDALFNLQGVLESNGIVANYDQSQPHNSTEAAYLSIDRLYCRSTCDSESLATISIATTKECPEAIDGPMFAVKINDTTKYYNEQDFNENIVPLLKELKANEIRSNPSLQINIDERISFLTNATNEINESIESLSNAGNKQWKYESRCDDYRTQLDAVESELRILNVQKKEQEKLSSPTQQNNNEVKETDTSSAVSNNAYAQAEAEVSAEINTIIVYNAQAYNKALDNAKRTGQDLDIKLADTAFTVEVREGKVQGKEVQFKAKNEKSEKQFRDVIRSKSHTFIEGKENSIALAHGELQIDMKRDANKAFVEISKGDRVKTLTLTSNESPEQLYEQVQGAIKDLDKAIDLDEPEEFTFDESTPSAKKTLEEIIEDAGEQANGQNDYEYVIPDETNLDDGFFDPRYT